MSLDDSDSETVLVLALGNPLMGDDGIGSRVVEELRARELPNGVALADGGTTGLALVGLMEEYQRVVAVDAADMGQPPGCVRKFVPSDVQFRTSGDTLSLHQVGFRYSDIDRFIGIKLITPRFYLRRAHVCPKR